MLKKVLTRVIYLYTYSIEVSQLITSISVSVCLRAHLGLYVCTQTQIYLHV